MIKAFGTFVLAFGRFDRAGFGQVDQGLRKGEYPVGPSVPSICSIKFPDIRKFDALSTDSRSVCKQIAEGKSDAEVLTPGHKKVSQVQATVRIACSEFGFNTGMYMTDRQNLGDLYKAYIAEMGARRKPASDVKDRGNSRAAPGPAPTDGSPSRPGAGDGNDKGSGAAPP